MKKILKITRIALVSLVSSLLILLWITDTTYLLKGVRTVYLRGQNDVGIYDYTVQATEKVAAAPGKPWELHERYNRIPLSDEVLKLHDTLGTTAFLIIKDGKILLERYFNEGGKELLSGVWSVTKTYTALLVLKAVEDGLIDAIDDPVTKYVPEWKVKQDRTLTLRHLA
ncbi:MAG: beta-lactamase family protein, partial [Sinomicrobium sp.]|nr:beta-lactamase family protein [Sinomicrobium sp.]